MVIHTINYFQFRAISFSGYLVMAPDGRTEKERRMDGRTCTKLHKEDKSQYRIPKVNMLKRVSERRHTCLTPTIDLNPSPVLPVI